MLASSLRHVPYCYALKLRSLPSVGFFTPPGVARSVRRRVLLAAIATGASLSGCLSRGADTPAGSTASPSTKQTATPVRHTADGITATFRVVDGHAPTDDTASATFEADRVTVTGTVDPSGCNRPTLTAIRYDAADGIVHLEIGGESPYGETATVECGNASFDYRCVLSPDHGRPTVVEVAHDYERRDARSFTLERN